MEVLVAMVIFSISALAVTSLMVNHTKLVSLNAQSSEAIVLAQGKLEDLRTMNFTSLASNSIEVSPGFAGGLQTFDVCGKV
jgi:Tfp pilus assembly protein PilV